MSPTPGGTSEDGGVVQFSGLRRERSEALTLPPLSQPLRSILCLKLRFEEVPFFGRIGEFFGSFDPGEAGLFHVLAAMLLSEKLFLSLKTRKWHMRISSRNSGNFSSLSGAGIGSTRSSTMNPVFFKARK